MNNITDHIARAKAAVAEGFTTKAAQQDAIATLNRGYEKARNWMHDRQIEAAPSEYPARSEFFAARDVPFDLHNVREKHLPVLAEYVPGLDGIVRDLIAVRAEVKAAPVNKAAPKPAPAPSAEEGRMTCQICGRPILANTGKIAHHGYERPGYGWQTASCQGAGHRPFEASRDELGRYIEGLNRRLDQLAERQRQHSDGELLELTIAAADYDLSAVRSSRHRPTVFVTVTAETFEAKKAEHPRTFRTISLRTFEDALARDLRETNTEIALLQAVIDDSEKRYEGWKQTRAWNRTEKVWERA